MSGRHVAILRSSFNGRPKSFFGYALPEHIYDIRILNSADGKMHVEWFTKSQVEMAAAMDAENRPSDEQVTPHELDIEDPDPEKIAACIVAMAVTC
jgi:hypothetical protein